jgi:hypothetical protein
MRKKTPEKKEPEEVKEPEPEQYFFDPAKETKKERETRINAIVKKALEGIIP